MGDWRVCELRMHTMAAMPEPLIIPIRGRAPELHAESWVAPNASIIGQVLLAARASVCETVVRRAIRQAKILGLLTVQERRVSHNRNLPNVIRITAPAWLSWLKMRGKGVGARSDRGRVPESKKGSLEPRNRSWAAKGQAMAAVHTKRPTPPWPTRPSLQNSALGAALDRWTLAFEKAKATG